MITLNLKRKEGNSLCAEIEEEESTGLGTADYKSVHGYLRPENDTHISILRLFCNGYFFRKSGTVNEIKQSLKKEIEHLSEQLAFLKDVDEKILNKEELEKIWNQGN